MGNAPTELGSDKQKLYIFRQEARYRSETVQNLSGQSHSLHILARRVPDTAPGRMALPEAAHQVSLRNLSFWVISFCSQRTVYPPQSRYYTQLERKIFHHEKKIEKKKFRRKLFESKIVPTKMFARTEYQLLTPPELGERCFLAGILHSLLGVVRSAF